MDASEALVLLFGVAIVGTLLAVLPPWRRLMDGGRELPIHRFFAQPSLEAEVRCAFCPGREECLRRDAPPEDCPNLKLLQERKAL
jgi:hypothetical protein